MKERGRPVGAPFLLLLMIGSRFALQAAVGGREGVAALEAAGGEAFLEPAHALGRGAVGEALGGGVAAGFLLQVVVAYLLGGVDGFFDVAVFERAEHAVLVVTPDAGIVVGLQLDADGGAVLVVLVLAGHLAMGLVEGAEEMLHMMAHLVGDDIGAGEVAAGSDGAAHLVEEVEVEVYLLVGRAVEGACRRGGAAAGALYATMEEDELGGTVGEALLLEFGGPDILGAGEDLQGEDLELLFLCRGGILFGGLQLGGGHLLDDLAGVFAQEEHEEGYDDGSAAAEAGDLADAAFATTVFIVGALSAIVEVHKVLC